MAQQTAHTSDETVSTRVNTDACMQFNYGGEMRECISYIRDNAPDSDLDAAPVAVKPSVLPTGRNF